MALRQNAISPTALVTGYRGTAFVLGLAAAGLPPARVISYPQVGDRSRAFETLSDFCRSQAIAFEESRSPALDADALTFVVAWQFLLRNAGERCVVFHDSLLPRLRGFSPTVTALLTGDQLIGVTAFQPTAIADTGPLYGSRSIRMPSGATLQTAFDLQNEAMVALAIDIAEQAYSGQLVATAQEEAEASHSLWRDEFDFFIDWRQSAQTIVRQVAALGYPYGGAKAVLANQVITILQAQLGPEVNFAIRDPGKLWEIQNRRALVVCGSGTLWIEEALDAKSQPFLFRTLRTRFLTADTAWIAPFAC